MKNKKAPIIGKKMIGKKMGKRAKTFRIHVTAADIEIGFPGDCALCPVALAIQRRIGPKFGVGLRHLIKREKPAENAWESVLELPDTVTAWVGRFDNLIRRRLAYKYASKPFTFTLRVPANALGKTA